MTFFDRYRAAVSRGELKDDDAQRRAAARLEALAKALATYRPRRRRQTDSSAELRAIAADIESTLGVPVNLAGTINRGRLELRYSSREELERVCAKLTS